jgi:DUF4097 and DUF4098 domain-containing protein YvlB
MSPKSYIIPLAIVAAGVGWMVSKPIREKSDNVTVNVVRASVAVDEWCKENAPRSSGWYCEVREFTMPTGAVTGLDASPNGGIQVEGWDKSEVQVRAKIEGRARTNDLARKMVEAVSLATADDMLHASGPKSGRGESWSVSYRAMVPTQSDLALHAMNGEIKVSQVLGDIQVRTTNGEISLEGVGGDVRGGTTNGSVRVELAGDAWDGEGVDIRTTNGSVDLYIPSQYNGVLEAATTNGRIDVDFPITVTGKIGRRLHTELGHGGATISATTTNGSVRIRKR